MRKLQVGAKCFLLVILSFMPQYELWAKYNVEKHIDNFVSLIAVLTVFCRLTSSQETEADPQSKQVSSEDIASPMLRQTICLYNKNEFIHFYGTL